MAHNDRIGSDGKIKELVSMNQSDMEAQLYNARFDNGFFTDYNDEF